MKKKFAIFTLIIAIVLGITGIIGITKNVNQSSIYAEPYDPINTYSYQENRDGVSLTEDNYLKVTFTLGSLNTNIKNNLRYWVVYLYNGSLLYNNDNHLYNVHGDYNTSLRGRSKAECYFVLDKKGYDQNGNKVTIDSAGTYSLYVPFDAGAYYQQNDKVAIYEDQYAGTKYHWNGSRYTILSDLLAGDVNYEVAVGPLYKTGSNNSYDEGFSLIDYYAGNLLNAKLEAGAYKPEDVEINISFNEQDGTLIKSNTYENKLGSVSVSGVAEKSEANFIGWYCDATNQTYQSLAEISALNIADLTAKTNTVNFYAVYQRGNGKYIEFTPVANYTKNYDENGDTVMDGILLETTTSNTTFTVTYPITHNNGVNALLLIPTYDKTVFSIVSAVIDEQTALGEATVTYDAENQVYTYEKILFDNENTYSSLNNAFITITYNIDHPVDGEYKFGFKLAPYIHNDVSEAWVDDEHTGNQNEVDIRIVETTNIVKIYTYRDAEIEIGETAELQGDARYEFVYAKAPAHAEQVAQFSAEQTNLEVEYTYTGTATPVVKWYQDENGEYEINGAPVAAGNYYVGISAPAHGLYHAVAEEYRLVTILPRNIYVTIDNKTSAYGDAIVALTATQSANVLEGDKFTYTLSTSATSTSPVGTYTITGTTTELTGSYVIHYTEDAVYTITKKSITIHLKNQTAPYTGSEPAVDQTMYDEYGTLVNTTVTITKELGVNAGPYALSATSNNPNYELSCGPATFTITSVGKTAEYLAKFFAGRTVVYNAQQQDLLVVKAVADDEEARPNWFSYSSLDKMQTNVNQYVVHITVTLTEEDANNWTNGAQELYLSVNSEITPYALTITADDKTSQYGVTPDALTPAQVNGLGEDVINVSYTTKNGNETITLSKTTPVGDYDIVPSAANSNYTFSYVNGTYSIIKATPTINLSANNVLYNRQLSWSRDVVVNELALSAGTDYTVVFKNANNQVVSTNSVLDAGVYTITISVPATANYNSAERSTTFTISKVNLATPTVSYSGAAASWTEVETDAGNVELHNATVTYKINNGEYSSAKTYTATAKEALTLYIHSSNANYNDVSVDLAELFAITFAEGVHANNPASPANMPEAQLVFAGQLATLPLEEPTLAGYDFDGWDFVFATQIAQDTTIVALWDAEEYTLTFKFAADDAVNVFTITAVYNQKTNIAFTTQAMPTKTGGQGYGYVYNNKALAGAVEYAAVYANGVVTIAGFTVTGDATFIAQYDIDFSTFTITYHVSYNGGDYEQYQQPVNATYLDTIEYKAFSTDIHWFIADGWYANEDRTQAAPKIMPAQDIDVYGAVVFNIGQGDINGDGRVTTGDITLYRQWIVGGYEMTVVANGQEWATATDEDFDAEIRYLLVKVADNNGDGSKDIRDVSITRMAIVGGYAWDKENGYNVSGHEIIRNAKSATLNAINDAINAGKKVTLADDVEAVEGSLNIITNKNVYIDLGGHTLTLNRFSLVSTSYSTITVKNGTIVTEAGITISAPYGNVVLEDVIGYVGESQVNLAAADHSLHFEGMVAFYDNKNDEAPVAVNVEAGTHVVVEPEAEVVVDKLVVTENFAPAQDADAAISLDNYSTVTDEIEVEGNVVSGNEISTLAELVQAAQNGGAYKLVADVAYAGQVGFAKDAKIDLNGHTLRSTNNVALSAISGATLVIEGNGNVIAQEACVMAFDGSEVVINGGTYTAIDNFVFGTNGTEGRGNNIITINAGTFNGGIVSAGYIACGVYVANNDIVYINGGTFNITNGVGMAIRAGKVTVEDGVEFNFTDNGRSAGWVGDKKTNLAAGKAFVLDLAAEYPGLDISTFEFVNNTDYDAVVLVKNETQLKKAKAFADTIVICNDMTNVDEITFTRDIVLDLNGHNVTFKKWGFEVVNNATLTINGNGIVSSVEATLVAQTRGHLVVNGGTYYATDNFVVGTQGSAGNGGSSITINAGTFNGGIQSAGYVACGIYVANSDTVTVNAGTFNITNGVGILARSGNTTVGANVVINATGNGACGKVGDSQVTVPAGEKLVLDLAANYPGGDPTLTNNTQYKVCVVAGSEADMTAAKNRADANKTLLGANITCNGDIVYNKDMILDLNGKTITFAGWGIEINHYTLTINGNGGAIVAQEACLYAQYAGKLVVNGGTYTSYDNFVIGTNGTAGRGANEITVNAGTFNGYIESEGCVACGIYVANDDTVVVNGGTFNITNGVGILARCGHTTVGANVVINATGNGDLGRIGDSRVVLPAGQELVLDLAANYPGGDPTLTNNSAYTVHTVNA